MLKDLEEYLVTKARMSGEQRLREVEEEVKREFAKAREHWKALLKEHEEKVRKRLAEEEREKLSWARLEEKRMLAEAKEDILDEAFEQFKERIKAYTKERKYSKWLNQMIKKGIEEMGSVQCVVWVKKGDKKRVKVKGVEVKEGAEILGGAIVESKDGKVKIDLSLDALIRQREDEIRRELYKHIFS